MARLPKIPLALAVAALCTASAALADEAARRVALAPFGATDAASALYDAIELDLELVEDIVLKDPEPLAEALAGEPLLARPAAGRAASMQALGLLAVIAARVDERPAGRATLALVRAEDGALVYAADIDLELALEAPRRGATEGLLMALSRLDALTPLDEDALVNADLALVTDAAPTDDQPGPGAAAPPAPPKAAPETKRGPVAAAPDVPLQSAFDRIGRLRLSWAATTLGYRACQPSAQPSARTAAGPFACTDDKPTEVMLLSPAGGAVGLELFPVPFAGLEVSASLFSTQVRALAGGAALPFSPNPFSALGGALSLAPVARFAFEGDGLAFFIGARAGYHLAWMLTESHALLEGGAPLAVTLLPSYLSHALTVGPTAGIVLWRLVRLSGEVDGLFGYHHEWPTAVGGEPFSLGLRGSLEASVDVALGLFASARLEGEAVSARTKGPGARLTRALVPFDSGQVSLVAGRLALGLGYRF